MAELNPNEELITLEEWLDEQDMVDPDDLESREWLVRQFIEWGGKVYVPRGIRFDY